jgi:hypothetical protein
MMKISDKTKREIRELRKNIVPILRRNGVVSAGVFGSFVRGELKKKSDIDILVRLKGRKSLLDLVGLKLGLEERLKRRVDVIEYSGIHPLLRKRILAEEARLL